MEGLGLISPLLEMTFLGYDKSTGTVIKGRFFRGARKNLSLAQLLTLSYRFHMDRVTKSLRESAPDPTAATIAMLNMSTASMGDALAVWALARDEGDRSAAIRVYSSIPS